MNWLIRNGLVLDQTGARNADIRITDGRIAEIGEGLTPQGEEVFDAGGACVAPGLVDMHCHLREPGFTRKETIATGTAAAVKGGFTALGVMANTSPVIDSVPLIEYVQKRAGEAGKARVYPYAAVTKGMQGKELTEMLTLKAAGAAAFSDDGKPVADPLVMRRALQYSKDKDILIISHCEDPYLADGGVMNDGAVAALQGLRGLNSVAEEAMVARDMLLAESLGARVHLAHISSARSVQLIREAKARGVQVTCETTPHYISLTERECENFNTYAKVNPPLRTEKDVSAVIEGLLDGTIDCIATDHAPHHEDDKRQVFELAANGFSGLETALAVCITYLVKTGKCTLAQLIDRMSRRPAEILGIPGGRIEAGAPADVTVFDPDETWTVDPEQFLSKGHNTPWAGKTLSGVVKATFVDGRRVY